MNSPVVKREVMKNITVSVDEETYRSAKEWATIRGTSVSALVREYLNALPQSSTNLPKKTLGEIVADIHARGGRISVSDNLSRKECTTEMGFVETDIFGNSGICGARSPMGANSPGTRWP